ncbi:hypothetical protein BGW38_004198 [Lunasporangiospora selenospora]|uniref:Brix domain-containing protein n=1 Tax=Lunasporangiospora selenospora TaxID=979761 RepID=A0A9P6FRP8_9FUNG|nr:hypothetical protein BGW38_004198 [Lunasporangiospora selenospora]
MQLSEARRVVLLNYNSDTKHIDFRHYSITVKAVGVSKSIKRVINTAVPDLQGFDDISDYVLRGAYASESDQDQRAIKLVELGPRMELRLVKVQAGMCDGEVLFHDFIKRTPGELKAQKVAHDKKLQEKAARRKTQEQNVVKKKAEKEAAKEAHRLATGGAPRKKQGEDDEDEEPQAGKRKRVTMDVDQSDEEDEGEEDTYSDMGEMAPDFSDEEFSGGEDYNDEDPDHMEAMSDDDM